MHGVEVGRWVRIRRDHRRYFVERRDMFGWVTLDWTRTRFFRRAFFAAEAVARSCATNPPFTEPLDAQPSTDTEGEK
jgi:hypothetical protein